MCMVEIEGPLLLGLNWGPIIIAVMFEGLNRGPQISPMMPRVTSLSDSCAFLEFPQKEKLENNHLPRTSLKLGILQSYKIDQFSQVFRQLALPFTLRRIDDMQFIF